MRLKLIIVSVSLMLAGGFIVCLNVYINVRNSLVDLKETALIDTSIEQAHETTAIFSNSKKLIDKVVLEPEMISFLNNYVEKKEKSNENEENEENEEIKDGFIQEEIVNELSNERVKKIMHHYNVGGDFEILYLMNAEGDVVLSTDQLLEGNNYAFRDYFQNALTGNFFVDYSIGVTTGEPGYYFSKGIRGRNGEVVGVVVGKMNPELINLSISNSQLNKAGETYLIDRFGVIIYSTESERLYNSVGEISSENLAIIEETQRYAGEAELKDLEYEFLLPEIKDYSKPRVWSFFDKLDNEDEIISLVKLGQFPFFISSEIERDDFIDPAIKLGKILSLEISIIVLIVSFVLTYFLNRKLRYLDRLKEASVRMGKGDFSKKIDVKGNDELSEIATTLNETSDKLNSMYKDIESKVKERTARLQKMNDFMINRELKMKELKRRIKELEQKKNNSKKDKDGES